MNLLNLVMTTSLTAFTTSFFTKNIFRKPDNIMNCLLLVFQEGKLNTEYWKEMTTLIIDFLLSCKNLGIQCAITIQNKTNFWMLWMSCDNCTLFGYLSPGYASFCWPYKVVNWKHGIHYSNSSEERLSQIVGVRDRV